MTLEGNNVTLIVKIARGKTGSITLIGTVNGQRQAHVKKNHIFSPERKKTLNKFGHYIGSSKVSDLGWPSKVEASMSNVRCGHILT